MSLSIAFDLAFLLINEFTCYIMPLFAALEGKVLCLEADLSKADDCKCVVSSIVKHFGHLDFLVNSAGILVSGGIESVSMEDYDKQMNINTRSLFLVMKLALPHLLERKAILLIFLQLLD